MRKKIFAIIFLFLLLKPVILFSAEGISPDSDDLDSLRDPFTPQLPLPPLEKIHEPVEAQNPPREKESSPVSPRPLGEKPLPPEIKISGLIWNTNQPQAIINDRIVKVGDQIEKWTIQKIDKDGIEISSEGKNILIPANFSVPGSSSVEPVNSRKRSLEKRI